MWRLSRGKKKQNMGDRFYLGLILKKPTVEFIEANTPDKEKEEDHHFGVVLQKPETRFIRAISLHTEREKKEMISYFEQTLLLTKEEYLIQSVDQVFSLTNRPDTYFLEKREEMFFTREDLDEYESYVKEWPVSEEEKPLPILPYLRGELQEVLHEDEITPEGTDQTIKGGEDEI